MQEAKQVNNMGHE